MCFHIYVTVYQDGNIVSHSSWYLPLRKSTNFQIILLSQFGAAELVAHRWVSFHPVKLSCDAPCSSSSKSFAMLHLEILAAILISHQSTNGWVTLSYSTTIQQ